MSNLKNILLVIDTCAHSPAWHRAMELARRSSAAVHILLLAFDRRIEATADLVDEDVQRLARDQFVGEYLHELGADTAALNAQGLRASCEVLWAPVPWEAVIARTLELRPELVIADLRRERFLKRWEAIQPAVFKLARFCPAPLMLVQADAALLPAKIVAAVDPSNAATPRAVLDDEIVRTATTLGLFCEAEVDLVHVFPYKPLHVAPYRSIEDSLRQVKGEDAHRFQEFADFHSVPSDRRHLLQGDPARKLLSCAESMEAGLIVVGAFCRSGLERLFLGSTAERVIQHAACDVLLVRPPGFANELSRHLDLPTINRRYGAAPAVREDAVSTS